MDKSIIIFIVFALVAYFFFSGSTTREAEIETIDSYSRGEEIIQNTTPEKIKTNACGVINFGLPNYIGTPKEGQTCMDAPVNERDAECINNPPSGYDGFLIPNAGYSNPYLNCCFLDGTCQWE